jgi:DMSO/TMAO reductase YedYZ molybdopterin-dependent catalytic subunit
MGKFFQKPTPELANRVPPGQYLATGFPVLTYGDTPQIAVKDWQLKVQATIANAPDIVPITID